MKNKTKAGLFILAATISMVGCHKKEPEPKLGEIKVVENNDNKIKKVVDEVAKTSISVDAGMQDKEVPFYNFGTFNDGGFIDYELSAGFANENVKSLVTTPGLIMHKDLDNNIYVDDMNDFNTLTISKEDEIYEPYKFGVPGVYVMSMHGASSNYKVYANGETYEIETDKDLILADEENAYLLDDGKLYRYNYDSGIENEMEVTLKGAPVTIKAALDRFKNKTIMLHINNDGYLVRLRDISGNTLELQPASKIKVDDIEKILRNNARNDCDKFLYKSTDGKLKVYDKVANKVTIELPDITVNLDIDILDSSVYYGDINKGEYVIFFTDGYKTYRYVSKSSVIYRVSQQPLEKFGEHFQGLVTVHNDKMVYKFVTLSNFEWDTEGGDIENEIPIDNTGDENETSVDNNEDNENTNEESKNTESESETNEENNENNPLDTNESSKEENTESKETEKTNTDEDTTNNSEENNN